MLLQPLAPFLQRVVDRLAALDIFPRLPNHVLVNEYKPGQGIMPHTDGPLYTPVIATISLQAHTVIDFQDAHGDAPRFSVLLQPRSLFLVADALYTGLHGIAERTTDVLDEKVVNLHACKEVVVGQQLERGVRVSLTIRNVPKARAIVGLRRS